MRRPVPLPAPLDNSAFTVTDALDAGLSREQLRSGNVARLGRGIHAPHHVELDLPGLVRPYTRYTSDTAASHDTAARLWDFPEPSGRRYGTSIHILRPLDAAKVTRKNVVGHRARIDPSEVTYVRGLYLTTRERTWLDLAESLPVDDLVVIADHLVRVPRPEFEGRSEAYATVESLGRLLARHPGKRGIRRARAAMQLCRVGADSPPETRLRLALQLAGLPEPQVNMPLVDAFGVSHHSPDLSIPAFRIAIEYDGGGHGHPDQVDSDIAREERVRAAGWIEVRISKRHMANGAELAVKKIKAALISQGWRPAA